MTNNILLSMFFSALYQPEEYYKIDLCSRAFYSDAVDYYSKKGNTRTREEIIDGIRHLSLVMKYEDLVYANAVWSEGYGLLALKAGYADVRSGLKLGKDFMDKVTQILESSVSEKYQKKKMQEIRDKLQQE
jgi:hypothetical protein